MRPVHENSAANCQQAPSIKTKQDMYLEDSSLPGILQLPDELGVPALAEGLQSVFQMSAFPPVDGTRIFYDTFEWTLWFNNMILYHDGFNLVCSAMNHGWTGATLATEPSTTGPGPFPSSWPAGPLRKQLENVVGLRALMPIAEIHSSTRTVELLNAEQKVVCRFDLISLFESADQRTPGLRLCQIRPLRGYGQEAAVAVAQLEVLGFTQIQRGPLEQFLVNSGRSPAPYTLRPVFGLRPEEPCREAVRNIVRRMLALARQQEQGIVDDIDTEFLHDYRICLRKIRSIFSLMKGVYPEVDTARLKIQWSNLARATNQLRDLDVYLLDREKYIALLPDSQRAGLNAFFAGVQHERLLAQQHLRKFLQSKSYRETIAAFEAFFTEPDKLPASEFSAHPVKNLASRRIYHRYRRIRKAGRAITSATPDDAIHQLRIECKKLRYMLEFFGELYDHDELDSVLKDLKQVQNSLGLYNDYAVQQASLLTYCEAHRETLSVEQALSVGGLVAVLNLRQCEERARAESALHVFSKGPVHQEFRRAFQPSAADAA
jgi:CHAD domain-containing protein